MNKIPKVIHYCWLSKDSVPNDLQHYMDTWKEHLGDYEFVKWDFSRFDINRSDWVREAFENKKYAFAADYIRMYALYTEGGIYLDMDVEVLKSFDNLLDMDYFMCYENNDDKTPEVAVFGAKKGCVWISDVLSYYEDRHFVKADGTFDCRPLPKIAKAVLTEKGYTFKSVPDIAEMGGGNFAVKELVILPFEFFSPKSYSTGEIQQTDNTYSIHQFSGTWKPWEERLERRLWLALGMKPHAVMRRINGWLAKVFHLAR